MSACACTDKYEVGGAGEYVNRGDTIHTTRGCYHASLLDVWHRAQLAAEVLRGHGMVRLAVFLENGTIGGRAPREEKPPATEHKEGNEGGGTT